jgi:hypothetical protein
MCTTMQRLNQQGFRKTGCLTAQHHATPPFASPRSPAAAGAPAYGRPQSARPHFARNGAAPATAATTAAHSTDDDDLSVQGSAVSPVKAAAVRLPPRVRPASAAAAAYAPRSTAAATLPAGGWGSSARAPSLTGATSAAAAATVAATAGNGARSGAAGSAQQHEWSDEEESIGESLYWQSDSPRGAERSFGASSSYRQQNHQQQQQQQLQEGEDDEWRVTMAATLAAGPVNRGARGCRGAANPLLDPYRTTGGLALEYTAQSRRREVQHAGDKALNFTINIYIYMSQCNDTIRR